jgi:hypothetical protein
MSIPSSYTMPGNGPHLPLQEELAQHRAKIFEALSRHSDPTIREIGRQLAGGAMAPHELLKEPQYVDALRRRMAVLTAMDSDDLHRRVFGIPRPDEQSGRRPRSGPDDHDGGVPAVRR